MFIKNAFFILSAVVIIVTGIFLPYTHGDYDYFVAGISSILQFGIAASLLLVPIGLIWCVMDFSNRKNFETVTYPGYFRRIARVITVLIILASALGAFASNNRFSAIIILGLGIYIVVKINRKVKDLKSAKIVRYSITPYYFIFIPLVAFLIRLTLLEDAKNNSTDFVIQQSTILIQDIEAYKNRTGHYPPSLLSTIEDYHTSVSGIQRFHYELKGEAYNLYFTQFSNIVGTEEIVMYNKLDEHEMTVHNQDLLRIPDENILRGYHQVVALPQQHWKIFYFD